MTDHQFSPHLPVILSPPLPPGWSVQVEPQLANEEKVLAWLETDLDAQLYFSSGLVVITNKRLLAKEGGKAIWHDWPYRSGLRL
jgi:ATP-binding cassette subfamily B protein